MQKLLFIGATGMLGHPVAMELVRAGFDISLLARNTAKTANLFPGSPVIHGDVFDKDSLVKAMTGMDTVYCNLSVLPASKEKDPQPEREGITNIVEAAGQAGVQRIVYLSSLAQRYEGMNGFSWWAFKIKRDAIEKIKASGVRYTIFYPSTFMETYPRLVQGKTIPVMGRSLFPMWFVSASDYGKQVAVSLRIAGDENREYVVQGPEPYTWDEANKIFIENYRKARLKTMRAPSGMMKFMGLFRQEFNYVWHICEALNKYPEKFESEQTWKELGTPTTTLAEFARSL